MEGSTEEVVRKVSIEHALHQRFDVEPFGPHVSHTWHVTMAICCNCRREKLAPLQSAEVIKIRQKSDEFGNKARVICMLELQSNDWWH